MNPNSAADQAAKSGSTLLVSGIVFGVSAIISLAFVYYLATGPARLADAWVWVRSLPLVAQLVLWLLFLPWMIVLWMWSQPWATALRMLASLVVLAVANYLLFPWKK